MASKRELQLVRLACRRRWLTAEQGEDCLFLKRQLGDKLTIEQIFRQQQYLTDEQIMALGRAAGAADRRRRSSAPSVSLVAPTSRPDMLQEPVISPEAEPSAASTLLEVPPEQLAGPKTTEEAPLGVGPVPSAFTADDEPQSSSGSVGDEPPPEATVIIPSPLSEPSSGPEDFTEFDLSLSDLAISAPREAAPTVSVEALSPSAIKVDDAARKAPPPRSSGGHAAFDPVVDDGPGRFGAYDVHYLIARGARSAVVRATHTESRRDVALKILLAPSRAAAAFVSDRGEALVAAAQLDDPRVVRVLDVGTVERRYYVALEHVAGWALDDKIATKSVSLVESLTIAADVTAALAAAERQGVVHADVAPEHIIVDDAGRARLTGFGFHHVVEGRPGTPGFMAPEVANGAAPTSASDQYGLGAVLYRLVVGRPAFDARSPEERLRLCREVEPPDPRLYRPDVPNGVAQTILRLMARNPAERFPNLQAVADELESLRAPLADAARRAAGSAAIPAGPILARALVTALGLILAAFAVPLGLDMLALMPASSARLAGLLALWSTVALSAATVVHVVVGLIRRGDLPLPRSSAWLVRGQELTGLIGATLLVAGFAVGPPAALNLALAGAGTVILTSGLFGTMLRQAVAAARFDGGVGRVLGVLGHRQLVRWRHLHIPGLTTVTAVAIVRSMALAYFAAS